MILGGKAFGKAEQNWRFCKRGPRKQEDVIYEPGSRPSPETKSSRALILNLQPSEL
jgi:hypothetical protein